MLRLRRVPITLAAALGLSAMLAADAPVHAGGEDGGMCRVLDVDMTPSDDLQIVVWLEDAAGEYVDTLYVTELTGRRGLGNRPGRMDFNSGPKWPYGRRVGTFPVWAMRHGMTWPKVIFQNDDGSGAAEDHLSHPFNESSVEAFYCRPLRETEPGWDSQSCASTVYTDKGVLGPDDARYPPRLDVAYQQGTDDPSVAMFSEMNPFDAVSQATPPGGVPVTIAWSIPDDLPLGDYVMWVEVSKEFDHNATYNPTTYPEPTGILYGDYGMPYRGQPSVVYQVPFTIGEELSIGMATSYAGYGDPDGIDGDVRPPDDTIDVDVPGSGAQRLLTTIDGTDAYRVRVEARLEFDDSPPGAPAEMDIVDVTSRRATVSFVEPGDDGVLGKVEGYEIRYRAGTTITEDDFLDASPVAATITPDAPGVVQLVDLDNLLPQTPYYVAIRAFDDCKNYGPITVIEVTTLERETGEVDACFVATAAYGSLLANDVEMLRHVRDAALRSNVAGELLVEAYYTFGPALAGVIGESEELRGLARDLLEPVVGAVKAWSFVDVEPSHRDD